MLRFNSLTIKNFASIGENTQHIDLQNGGLTLILGENYDTANDISIGRNGVGKCLRGTTSIEVSFKSKELENKFLDFLKSKP